MKIINLILYSPSDEYDMMKDVLENYLKEKKIEHYFYSYREDLQEEFVIEGNQIFIRGVESYVPGVLDKTLKAFEIFRDHEYDYIVRSNVSTIVDFEEIQKYLLDPVDYSGFLHTRCYLDAHPTIKFGMSPEKYPKYQNYHWISGICVVLSRKAVKMLVGDEKILRGLEMIDDMAMGVYFHERPSEAVRRSLCGWDKAVTGSTTIIPGTVVYRNKSDDRTVDVCRMNAIIKALLDNSD